MRSGQARPFRDRRRPGISSLSELLSCQQQLASTVARIVELARTKRWEQLPALDAQCAAIVERLRGMEARPLASSERERMLALAGRIRADQDELSALVRPQFLRLMQKIGELERAAAGPATA